MEQKGLSYIAPSQCNNIPLPDRRKKTTVLNICKHKLKSNNLGESILIGLSLVLAYISYFTYLFVYLFTHLFIYSFYLFVYFFIFLSHLFSLCILAFILPIYHFLYLLSQSILYYLLCINSVISVCS